MPKVINAAVIVGWLVFGTLTIVIVSALFMGVINMRGLLMVKRPGAEDPHEVSSARVQMLLATVATAVIYIGELLNARGTGTLPEIDTRLLYGLGASHGFYLISKLQKFVNLIPHLRPPSTREDS